MMEDPKNATIDHAENTEEERQAQYKKDKADMEKRNQETDLLLKQLDNIKNIDALAKESGHADRFKNI